MHIFEPFNINKELFTTRHTQIQSSTPNLDFEDPEAMYTAWIAPYVNLTEYAFTKKEFIEQLSDIFEVYLDLKKNKPKITRHQLLKEMSIQVSLYEALIFRIMFLNQPSGQWHLNKSRSSLNSNYFEFTGKNEKVIISIEDNNVILSLNKKKLGTLKMDMEHIILEKIYGSLFNRPFVIDPIWLKKQVKLDAVKLQIDSYKTEVVHKPNHKDTMWTNGKDASIMSVSVNKSLSLNKKLLINIKKIHWKNYTLHSMQCYSPWYRLPIKGFYKLLRC